MITRLRRQIAEILQWARQTHEHDLAKARERFDQNVFASLVTGHPERYIRALREGETDPFLHIILEQIQKHDQVLRFPDEWRQPWQIVIDSHILVTITSEWICFKCFCNPAWVDLSWIKRHRPATRQNKFVTTKPALTCEIPALF